jgi:hypothetical protein
MALPLTADGEGGLQAWRVAANILNKSSGKPVKCGIPDWGLGVGLPIHRKNKYVTKYQEGPLAWKDSLNKRPKRNKMGMEFGSWNISSLYRTVSRTKLDI